MEGHKQQQQISPFYHVPQQSRREKLRYPSTEIDLLHPPTTHSRPTSNLFNTAATADSDDNRNTTPLYMGNPNYSAIRAATSTAVCLQQRPMFANQSGVSLSLSSSPYTNNGTCRGNVEESIRIAGPSRPSEPFTGYAAVLNTSRFLGPAQQMLKDICSVGGVGFGCGSESGELGFDGGNDGGVFGVKSRLISMLDEVYRRYKQYVQQIQYVMTCFECIAGLGDAAPYTSLAIKAMTKHFRRLKNCVNKEGEHSKEELHGGYRAVIPDNGVGFEGLTRSSTGAIGQQNLWRHQRGLPESAVAVLKAWLFEHFLHPYPSDTDKHLLAKQTGLSRNQVSNWFINARVRLWKPLVEEIHSLEMRQARSSRVVDSDHDNDASNFSELPMMRVEGNKVVPPHKRLRNDQSAGEILSDGFTDHHGNIVHNGGGNTGISLTLDLLHQSNKITVPDPLLFNVARRFGLEEEEGFNDL